MSEVKFTHVYPINDIKEHDIITCPNKENLVFEMIYKLNKKFWACGCSCQPEIDFENNLIIHNSFDMREINEYISDKER